jgi:hypothetical protein
VSGGRDQASNGSPRFTSSRRRLMAAGKISDLILLHHGIVELINHSNHDIILIVYSNGE